MTHSVVLALQLLERTFAVAVALGVTRRKVLVLVELYWPLDEEKDDG